MEKINTFVLSFTISIIDYLYRGRHFQRFWVFEEISFGHPILRLSVLHLRESLGLRGQWHIYLVKEHFEQSVNETEHLGTWNLGAVILIGLIAHFLCQTPRTCLLLDQCGLLLVISSRLPSLLRNEMHAAAMTYAKYLAYEDYNDKKIWEIMNDEIQHFQELAEAMRILDPDHLTVRKRIVNHSHQT